MLPIAKRRKNELTPVFVNIIGEKVPEFTDAEKLFYANEKSKNRLKRTIEWHKENIHAFKKAMFEQGIELNLSTITHRTIRNNLVLYAIEKWGNKPQTVNMRLRTLKQFFSFLVSEGYLAENPAARVEKLKTAKTMIDALNKDQVRRLLAVPDKNTFTGFRDYTIMLMLVDTGLRLSEITGLRIPDLHFTENYIKVMGKGAKERTVPLQGKLKKTLKEYLQHRGKEPEHDFVFINIDNEPIKNRTIQDRLGIISKKAGVTEIRTSPHTWRHTFARMYILNGGDAFSLKTILGHNSWEMVHRYVQIFGTEVNTQHLKASPLKNLDNDY